MSGKIRVMIVDDAVVVRRMLASLLVSDPEIEIAGTAKNGRIALEKLGEFKPDVVILDLDMPEMNGLETLVALQKKDPTLPVIAFSTVTERGAAKTLEALSLGAADYVTKPSSMEGSSSAIDTIREELTSKLKTFGGSRKRHGSVPIPLAKPPDPVKPTAPRKAPNFAVRTWKIAAHDGFRVLAIGTSTGGPNALAEVVPRLPPDFPIPVVIVQHMPPIFTRILAERLTTLSHLRVVEGKTGDILEPGLAYIAPGDYHMVVHRTQNDRVAIRTHQKAREHSCRPAVDVLFRSVSEVYNHNILAVVMTGMGRDGLDGCGKIKSSGGTILVQDETSSVVWGMPGLVAKHGLADKVLPLGSIGDEISRIVCGAAMHG
ncbi:MAG: chemotaxis response regulator protein-glutamate methylesterase [Myxococcota bacterium]|nr:chemotaxis response regulator protein-glutamate methylesterase [Myxococcota bacterium]